MPAHIINLLVFVIGKPPALAVLRTVFKTWMNGLLNEFFGQNLLSVPRAVLQIQFPEFGKIASVACYTTIRFFDTVFGVVNLPNCVVFHSHWLPEIFGNKIG